MPKKAVKTDQLVEREPESLGKVYLFCGEDSFSAHEKAKLWKEKFLAKYGELNLLTFQGGDLTATEFQTALESAPFLSEKKLIFIADFLADGGDDDQKAVSELLERVPDFCVVVFLEFNKPDARRALYKKLAKIATVENFALKVGPDLSRWIGERAKHKGLSIGSADVSYIADFVGSNLWNVENELAKLALFAGASLDKQVVVDRAMIEKVVSPNLTSSIFKLTDLLGEKRLNEVVKCFEILVESGEEVMAMLFMLVRHFRIMAEVKYLADRGGKAGDIAKEIKEHPFVVSKMMGQIRGFDMENLRNIYGWLLDLDTGIKMGRLRISTGDSSELEREMIVFFTKVCLK
ncbi:DNA polymerase III subunit delta [Candidatus Peregrinibacteria bacterium]|nr:DNA polymerase III subunit delta [Candidatus Peregrinibacteria bacterium]